MCNVNLDERWCVVGNEGGTMVRRSWWLAAGLTLGCASSAESSRPSPEAPAPVAAQALAAPEERALPDAGLTLQPMEPPAPGTVSDQRMEFQDLTPAAGASGFREVQNDAPPPTKSGLRISDRPYSAVPPKPDAQGKMPVPKRDPNTPTVPVRPQGPASTNAPPVDR